MQMLSLSPLYISPGHTYHSTRQCGLKYIEGYNKFKAMCSSMAAYFVEAKQTTSLLHMLVFMHVSGVWQVSHASAVVDANHLIPGVLVSL